MFHASTYNKSQRRQVEYKNFIREDECTAIDEVNAGIDATNDASRDDLI